MHPYSTDDLRFLRVAGVLAVPAVIVSYLIAFVVQLLSWKWIWWVDVPSIIGVYSGLLLLYEHILWRSSLARRLRLTVVPNLSGSWRVTLKSSHDQFAAAVDAELQIEQTWTRISVGLKTPTSRSRSIAAWFVPEPGGGFRLGYTYINEPAPSAAGTMHGHRGAAELVVDEKVSSLTGDYFSGRDRRNVGELLATRIGESPAAG